MVVNGRGGGRAPIEIYRGCVAAAAEFITGMMYELEIREIGV